MADTLAPFMIAPADTAGEAVEAFARGSVVRLQDSYAEVLSRHDYPPLLQRLLGELLAASAMLAASLKFNGSLVLQLQGDGALRLLVVECTYDLKLRAMAQWHGTLADSEDLRALAGNGRFAITLDPKDGGKLHQGIVPLEAGSVAQLLEHYLAQSEQLPSRLWLAAEDGVASGLLLQRMPGQDMDAGDAWNTASLLAQTVSEEELRQLDAVTLLTRLFAQQRVTLFAHRAVAFHCPCSRERVLGALELMGRDEVLDILQEQGEVEATCEFCNRQYRFAAADVAGLFDYVSATKH